MSNEIKIVNPLNALKKVSIALAKATDDNTKVEEAFGVMMSAEWLKLAKDVIKKSGNIKKTKKSVNKFLKYSDTTMNSFIDNIDEDMKDYIQYIYKSSKVKFNKDQGLVKVDKALPAVEPSLWIAQDTAAVESLGRITGNSAGKFYKSSVMKTVHESVKKNVFENPELTHAEAVEIMQKDLSKALRVTKGKLASKVVPKGYHGTAEQYFSGLANNSATLARTSSSVYSMQEVGAEYIIVRSVRTSRSCAGCLAIDGQKYKTSSAVKHLEKILNIDDVSEYKDIQPSLHFKTTTSSTPEQLAEAKKLKTDGAIYLPPLHFRCECYTDMG